MEESNRLNYLLDRFNNDVASPDELSELEQLLGNPDASGLQQDLWEKIPGDARFYEDAKSEELLKAIMQRNRTAGKIKQVHTLKKRALLVAATFLLLVTGGLTFKFIQPTKRSTPVADQHRTNIIAVPGGDKAILVLEDGSTVALDSTTNGAIAKQGGANISKLNGQVIYALNGKPEDEKDIHFNTIKTPRGGQYRLVLVDGTIVWMNAGSSLHFPTSFPGGERVVELTGEAYFEVAKDVQRRFCVKVNGISVNVLGTHFNVMAYENETATAITLFEGAVNVAKENDQVTLQPGQQAILTPGAGLHVNNKVNLEEAVAWKNGYFYLASTNLAALMRQVERWYNVDVVYNGKIPNRQFGGKISRKSDIQHVMKILEASNVYSRMEGNKLIILDK